MRPEILWSFSLLSIPDILVEHRRRIYSGSNSIPFPNHKQNGLLFKTSELKEIKTSEKIQQYKLFEIQWACYSQQIHLSICSKINQKRGKWCFKYHMPFLAQPYNSSLHLENLFSLCYLFANPFSIGKSQCIWPLGAEPTPAVISKKSPWTFQWNFQKGIWCNNLETKLKRTFTFLLFCN